MACSGRARGRRQVGGASAVGQESRYLLAGGEASTRRHPLDAV